MDKKQNLIPLQELNLTSRFLFDEVPRELAEFLHYLEETTDERRQARTASGSSGSIGGCVR